VRARAAGAAPQKAAREELLREHPDTLAAPFEPATLPHRAAGDRPGLAVPGGRRGRRERYGLAVRAGQPAAALWWRPMWISGRWRPAAG
jgi:hypothetical protein